MIVYCLKKLNIQELQERNNQISMSLQLKCMIEVHVYKYYFQSMEKVIHFKVSDGSSYDSGKQIGLKCSCELFLLCYYFNAKAEEWRMSPKTNLQHGRYDSNGLFVKCIPSNISLTSSQAANNSTYLCSYRLSCRIRK